MATREQWIAILSFIGAATIAISSAVALYYTLKEQEELKKRLAERALAEKVGLAKKFGESVNEY